VRFAYADPPYVGQAKRHYGSHRDFGGEVDHAELIARLMDEFDGWALSASMKSLRVLMEMCPADVLVLSWVKPMAPPMGDNRIYSWEPVILHGGRNPALATRTSLVASPPQFTFRAKPPGHVIGEKPEAFSFWLFQCAGLTPDDEFHDLFPGSCAVTEAWGNWCAAASLDFGGVA
jgi:hypothetical protein